jgi:lipopolysaccharide transport protein LptA
MKRWRMAMMALVAVASATAQTPDLPPLPEGTTDDIPVVGDLTVVTSERLVYDAEKQMILFEKDVVVSDPHLRMKTDKLTIFFDENNQPRRLLAEGRVVLSQAEIRAWAGRVSYDVVTGEIVLEEGPRVMRGKDLLMGRRITFWRNQNRLECDREARLIIYPEKGGARDWLQGGR